MSKIKDFFKQEWSKFTFIVKQRVKDMIAYPIDGLLFVFGVIVCIIYLFGDNLLASFLGAVLAMHSVYTAFRLNNVIKGG